MLRLGQGWGIDAAGADGRVRLAASIVVLPYGERFAWVSMVLVLPEFRRRGFAQPLLRHALARCAAQGRAAVLDATPAGHAVYVQEGFADTWGFARYRREAGARAAAARRRRLAATRALTDSDWPAIEALDTPRLRRQPRCPAAHAGAAPAAGRAGGGAGRPAARLRARPRRPRGTARSARCWPTTTARRRRCCTMPCGRVAGAGVRRPARRPRRAAAVAAAAGLRLPAPVHAHGARRDDSAGRPGDDRARRRARTRLTGSRRGRPTSSS